MIPTFVFKTPAGDLKYVITNVYGRDRQIYVQSMLKEAGLPSTRLETIGSNPALEDTYVKFFKSFGYKPDAVFYGFQKSLLEGIFRNHPLSSTVSAIKTGNSEVFEKIDLRNIKMSEIHGLPMAELKLQGGKRVWLLQNLYGDQVTELFSALGKAGVSNINFLGTAGSLSSEVAVGSIITPEKFLDDADQKIKPTPLLPLEGIPYQGVHGHVTAPAMETKAWAEGQAKAGAQFVEVEMKYFLQYVSQHPEIKAKAALIISDQLIGQGHSDLSNWGQKTREHEVKMVEPIFNQILGYTGTAPKIQSLHFYPLDQPLNAQKSDSENLAQ